MSNAAGETSSLQPEAPGTRERILDVAEALFASRGFAGAAIRDIARAAELTPASLYNHFAGKQALYEAVLERGVSPLLEIMESLPSRDNSAESLDDLLGAIMCHLASRPHLPSLIQQETLSGGSALAKLAQTWIRPMVEQGLVFLDREDGSPWSTEERANVIFAWLHLVFGYFTMAPMYGQVLGQDALSPEGIERQTRFLRKLADLTMAGSSEPSERTG